MSFPDRDDSPLIIVLLKVNHALNSPVDSKSTFQNELSVDFPRLHLETFVVEKVIVSFELRLDLSSRDVRTR